MIRRFGCAAAAFMAMFSTVAPCDADIFSQMMLEAKRVNCWPEPFYRADRLAVVAPLSAMVAKGWKSQTTVGTHHFEDDGNTLSGAGRMKVRWILSSAPEPYRTVYVHRAENSDTTARRVDGVQQYITKLIPKGELPPVVESDHIGRGRSAEYVDDVYRRFRSSIPEPRLIEASSGDGSE